MTSVFAVKLDLSIWPIDISIEKNDGFTLKIYNMVIAKFLI